MTRIFRALVLLTLLLMTAPAFAQGGEEVVYFHSDAIGSVRLVTDANGQVLQRYDYLPFGEPWQAPALPETRRFGGKERDAESGLDYFGARYYSSLNGRFTAIDPAYIVADNVVDPQRWNKYAYARNNPFRYVDPDGRLLDTIVDVAFTAYDLFDIGRSIYRGQGVSALQVGALAADVAGVFVPFATGGGAAVRTAAHAGEAARVVSKTDNGAAMGKKGVDFIVTEAGEAIPVPTGASGPKASTTGKGFVFEGGSGGHGLDPRTTNVRIMDPVGPKGSAPAYPGGYVTYENKMGQGVNPKTGRTVPDSDPSRHIPLQPKPKPRHPYEPHQPD